MKPLARAVSIVAVYLATCVAWLVLGSVMTYRSHQQKSSLEAQVNDLWGRPHVQHAPRFTLASQGVPPPLTPQPPPALRGGSPDWEEPGPASAAARPAANGLQPTRSELAVELTLDQRLKGLTWYSMYDVGFAGRWTYVHEGAESDELVVSFAFPDPEGVYDGFRFLVNGEPVAAEPSQGALVTRVPVAPGETVAIEAAYQSRGLDSWRYQPGAGTTSLRDFHLVMRTSFDDVDFPSSTLSPSTRGEVEGGQELRWDFEHVVSGHGIGMVMPQRIQPGELASSLSFSAPISLLFFFLVIAVLARLRGLDIHPINYFFLGATFFSFHLLFSYSVDHLAIAPAFVIASAVSVAMVVAYLRLVVSPRFAFVEAGLAQLVYLVGFSLAHFASGFTGLTVTVLSVATLFLLMLLTGRVRWSEVLSRPVAPPPQGAYPYPAAAAGPSPVVPPPEGWMPPGAPMR